MRLRRIELGMTLAELAELTLLSEATLANVELGRHSPRRLTARAIAEALDTTEEALGLGEPEAAAI
jgi:transcriptional regulator with XRE-family HTH domain